MPEPPPLDAIESLGFGLDVASADAVRGELTLHCATEADAALWTQRFTGQGPTEFGEIDLPTTMTATRTGSTTTATFDLRGLEAWLIHSLQVAVAQDTPDPEEGTTEEEPSAEPSPEEEALPPESATP